jgi:hypothetical protein
VRRRTRLVLRKQYRYYYLLTMLNVVQKQIAYVFGSWVIVDLLLSGRYDVASADHGQLHQHFLHARHRPVDRPLRHQRMMSWTR